MYCTSLVKNNKGHTICPISVSLDKVHNRLPRDTPRVSLLVDHVPRLLHLANVLARRAIDVPEEARGSELARLLCVVIATAAHALVLLVFGPDQIYLFDARGQRGRRDNEGGGDTARGTRADGREGGGGRGGGTPGTEAGEMEGVDTRQKAVGRGSDL